MVAVQPKSASIPADALLKLLIIVTGGKGGTGKSTFTRGLADVLQAESVGWAGVDGDTQNAQFHRYYHRVATVERADILAPGGADFLLDWMHQGKAQVILVDAPAGAGGLLANLEQEMLLLSSATRFGYAVTVVSVLSRVMDSVNALRLSLQETQGHPCQHIAVKNAFFGQPDRFSRFDASNTKQALLNQGGQVVVMPELADDTFELIDINSLPFRVAMTSPQLSIAHQNRVFRWLEAMEGIVSSIGAPLGVTS